MLSKFAQAIHIGVLLTCIDQVTFLSFERFSRLLLGNSRLGDDQPDVVVVNFDIVAVGCCRRFGSILGAVGFGLGFVA